MSYETFGHFGHEHVDDVIRAANKQKMAADVAHAVMSPLTFAVKKGVAVAAAGKNGSVTDEQYVKACVIKVLKDHSLFPDSAFKNKIRAMVKEILMEEAVVTGHPQWTTPNFKKNGYR